MRVIEKSLERCPGRKAAFSSPSLPIWLIQSFWKRRSKMLSGCSWWYHPHTPAVKEEHHWYSAGSAVDLPCLENRLAIKGHGVVFCLVHCLIRVQWRQCTCRRRQLWRAKVTQHLLAPVQVICDRFHSAHTRIGSFRSSSSSSKSQSHSCLLIRTVRPSVCVSLSSASFNVGLSRSSSPLLGSLWWSIFWSLWMRLNGPKINEFCVPQT